MTASAASTPSSIAKLVSEISRITASMDDDASRHLSELSRVLARLEAEVHSEAPASPPSVPVKKRSARPKLGRTPVPFPDLSSPKKRPRVEEPVAPQWPVHPNGKCRFNPRNPLETIPV